MNRPSSTKSATAVLFYLLCLMRAVAETYHIDGNTGDDSHDGTSPAKAWRSLDRVNRQLFKPGDRILFRSGTSYQGQLRPQGSGTEGNPVRIDRFGDGPLPRIDGEGQVRDAVLLRNIAFWEVQNLEVTNRGPEREPWRTGVRIVAEDFGKMSHIRLRRLYVRDVNGDLRKSHEGCGIYFETVGKQVPSHFDDLLIEECRVVRTDRNGICQRNGSGPRSLRVVIRRNLLEDIGGDGIKPWGCEAPVVEHNIVRGGRMRCADAAAGIWPFDCDDALIQFNEVSGMKGDIDGQGFDSDYRSRRSLFQYNYSHENEGGFMLICSPGTSHNDGTVIRYNISQNDGIATARVFQIGGNPTNTRIHNNTIYVGPHQKLPMVSCNEWDGGVPDGIEFSNNLFIVDGRVDYRLAPARNVVFSHNVFAGNHDNAPQAPSAIIKRPALRAPGTGKNGFASLKGYIPQDPRSFPRGKVIPDNGGRDFFGNALPADRPPAIGAAEPQAR